MRTRKLAGQGQSGFDTGGGDERWSKQARSALQLVGPYFRQHALRLCGGFAALMLVDFLQLCIPRIVKSAVDELQLGTATSGSLLAQGGWILMAAMGIGMLRFLWRYLLLGFSRLLETDLRDRLFAHILTLDRAFFQRRATGEIMALATNDLSSVQLAGGMGLVAAVDACFMGLAAIAFMAYIDPWLTLLALSPMPVLAIATRMLAGRLHLRYRRVQERFSELTEFVRATLASIRLVKAYNQERPQAGRFAALGEAYSHDNVRLAAVYGALFPLSGFIGNCSLLLIFVVGGRMTLEGEFTAGDFVAFMTYLFMITWPMMALGWVADLFQRGLTSLERIQSLLRERPILSDPPETTGNGYLVRGKVCLIDLSFTYPGQTKPALHQVSLEIPAGTLIGIVGRTGSGKTTLCHLLARFYPVPDGSILVDGRDVNRLPVSVVRGAVAYVPQEVTLFSNSIAFNITLGKPDASHRNVIAVAKACAIHDEIMAMPEGYETRIGERGVKLSGGQRQRLAMARALLLDRPILIIDDGLSAVDTETEHAIIGSIASYLQDRTCLVVSHRVAPLVDADRIVVLDEGRMVAAGTHLELLGASAFYASIYRQQVGAAFP